MSKKFLINRRTSSDRRSSEDPRYNPRLDLPHKRRRVRLERRRLAATRIEDFYAVNDMNMEDFSSRGLLH
jgi:hypothetical protein